MTKEKKKRTYETETLAPSALHLELTAQKRPKSREAENPVELRKQFFSPDLIARLAERIKKL